MIQIEEAQEVLEQNKEKTKNIDIELLSVKDIMNYLKISNKKAYSLLKVKGFPQFRIGNTYYIPKQEFENWIIEHARKNINITL